MLKKPDDLSLSVSSVPYMKPVLMLFDLRNSCRFVPTVSGREMMLLSRPNERRLFHFWAIRTFNILVCFVEVLNERNVFGESLGSSPLDVSDGDGSMAACAACSSQRISL